ncbi:MAG: PA14 domain-containing protein [bacterium]|nr:PA14 domain-containing protein [bacterium]
MKKLLALGLVLGFCGIAFAGLEEETWYPSGDGQYRVENGKILLKSKEGFFYIKIPREEPKDNFVLSLKAKIISGNMLIFFADGGYRLTLGDGARLERISGMAYRGSGTVIAQNPYWKAKSDSWHKMEITKKDAYIEVKIDDNLALVSAQSWGWSGADIGLGVDNGGEAKFDNIEIIPTEKKTRHGIDPRTNEDEIYTDKLTHEFITSKATNNFSSSENHWNYYKNRVLWGSNHEDREDILGDDWRFEFTAKHFYNPATGLGLTLPDWPWPLPSGLQDSSLTKAKEVLWPSIIEDYSKGRKWEAYYTLGRIAHLLEDTTSPAHCHLIPHNLRDWDDDIFEKWCPKQDSSNAYSTTQISEHSSLDDFFKETAYLAFGQATQTINGITANEVNSIVNQVYEASSSGNGKYKTYKMSKTEDGSCQEYLKRYMPKAILKPSGGFSAKYYNNKDLSGNPILTPTDLDIDFDWGKESPKDGVVNADQFSVRWEGVVTVSKVCKYTFYTLTDDGVRLYVDGSKIIDDWNNHSAKENSHTISLSAGNHTIKMEYYENTGNAVAKLYWESEEDNIRVETLAKYIFPATIMKVGGLLKYFDQKKQDITIDPDYIIANGDFIKCLTQEAEPGKKYIFKLTLKNLGDLTNNIKVSARVVYIMRKGNEDKEFGIGTFTSLVSLNPGEGRVGIESSAFIVPWASYMLKAYCSLEYAGKIISVEPPSYEYVSATPIIIEAPSSIEITPDNFNQPVPITIIVKGSGTGPLESAEVTLSGYVSPGITAKTVNGKASFKIVLDKQDEQLKDIWVSVYTGDVIGNYERWKSLSITMFDENPPKITKGPEVKQVGAGSAIIYWETDVKTPTNFVEYSIGFTYEATAMGRSGSSSHTVYLTELLALTTYNYRVKSSDVYGNIGASGNFTFTTKDSRTMPYLKVFSPEEGAILKGMVNISLETFDYETLTLTLSLINKNNELSPIGSCSVLPGTNTIEFPFDTENRSDGNYTLEVVVNDGSDVAIARRTFTIQNWPSSNSVFSISQSL